MPAVQMIEYHEPAIYTKGQFMKRLIQRLVADIPYLQISSVETDTDAEYKGVLSVSFASDVTIVFQNSTSYPYNPQMYIIQNGSNRPTMSPAYANSSNTNQDLYIFVGDEFFAFSTGHNSNSPERSMFFVGKCYDYFNGVTVSVVVPSNDFQTANNVTNGATAGVNNGAYGITGDVAFFRPGKRADGTGHLYAAVPIGWVNNIENAPIRGFIGGTDSIYKLFDNGATLNVQPYTVFEIDGHNFIAFLACSNTSGRLAFRLS